MDKLRNVIHKKLSYRDLRDNLVEHHLFCVNPKGEEPKQQTDREKNHSFKRNEKPRTKIYF